MPPITVLVAHGQRMLAEAMARALTTTHGLQVIGDQPTTGPEVVAAARAHRPDVIVLDYWIPGMGGPQATREMTASDQAPKVILVSWLVGAEHIQEALSAGAIGFLPSGVRLGQVAEAVRRAAAGDDLVYAEELAGLVDEITRLQAEAAERWRRLETLTPRELTVLRHLSRGLPRAETASQLSITVRTLDNHIRNILRKTGAAHQDEAVAMARLEKLVPPGSAPSGAHLAAHHWTA